MNKTVLITGVNGGMGYATAKYLMEKDYQVIGLDYHKESKLENIKYFQVDVTNLENIQNAYQSLLEENVKLQAIINFAGIYNLDSLVEISEEEFLRIFNINLFGVYRINKVFLPLLTNKGKVIITSSELAPLDPLPFTGLYGITKAALEKYAYSLRMELNLLDYQVVVVRPGAVKTTLLNDSTTSLDKFIDKTKLYKCNANKFKEIVDSVENKNIEPIKIGKLINKILNSKKPKYVYNINRNILLRLLSILPKRFQVWVIKKIIK